MRTVAITPTEEAPAHPYTLSIDVGGTGLKASVLSKDGVMVADRVRTETKYPLPPEGETGLVAALTALVKPLPEADRISCGFPGMVRNGIVLSAPHFVTKKGPGTPVDQKLFAAWSKFDLENALKTALGKPTKVANDADIQGAAVVRGDGLEVDQRKSFAGQRATRNSSCPSDAVAPCRSESPNPSRSQSASNASRNRFGGIRASTSPS